jgi:hypothetical protein
MNYESAVFALSTFFIAGAVLAGIVYCVIIIKELLMKVRSKHEQD